MRRWRSADAGGVAWAEYHLVLGHVRCLSFLARGLGCSCMICWMREGEVGERSVDGRVDGGGGDDDDLGLAEG